MSFCIFIASSTATTSPSFTTSPGLTGSFTMSPCIGAVTVPSPVFDRGGAAFPGARGAPAAGMTAKAGLETKLPDLLPCGLDLRFEEIRRADRDGLFAAEHQTPQLVIRRHGRPTVQALQVILQLLGDGGVPVATDHVVDRLRGDHLPDR